MEEVQVELHASEFLILVRLIFKDNSTTETFTGGVVQQKLEHPSLIQHAGTPTDFFLLHLLDYFLKYMYSV